MSEPFLVPCPSWCSCPRPRCRAGVRANWVNFVGVRARRASACAALHRVRLSWARIYGRLAEELEAAVTPDPDEVQLLEPGRAVVRVRDAPATDQAALHLTRALAMIHAGGFHAQGDPIIGRLATRRDVEALVRTFVAGSRGPNPKRTAAPRMLTTDVLGRARGADGTRAELLGIEMHLKMAARQAPLGTLLEIVKWLVPATRGPRAAPADFALIEAPALAAAVREARAALHEAGINRAASAPRLALACGRRPGADRSVRRLARRPPK